MKNSLNTKKQVQTQETARNNLTTLSKGVVNENLRQDTEILRVREIYKNEIEKVEERLRKHRLTSEAERDDLREQIRKTRLNSTHQVVEINKEFSNELDSLKIEIKSLSKKIKQNYK
jgi:phage host-nuclease inhibitor protein Gam